MIDDADVSLAHRLSALGPCYVNGVAMCVLLVRGGESVAVVFLLRRNLSVGPKLPAETLVTGCYNYLFYQSTNLNKIECLATTNISNDTYTKEWVKNVQTTSGLFIKKSGTSIVSGVAYGIPTNWTVQDAS